MTSHPTVAHFMRTFLSRTETFIGNQIVTLERYRPVVCCHARGQNADYPVANICSLQDTLPTVSRAIDEVEYRTLRRLPKASARKLAGYSAEQSARLLHFHYLVDARFFLAVKRLTGLPSVVSVYGYDVSAFPRMWFGYGARYLRPIFAELDCFLAMSEDMRQDLLKYGCPDEKIIVHYHGIDTDRFAYPERTYSASDTPAILVCGTLERKKAQDRVLLFINGGQHRRSSRRSPSRSWATVHCDPSSTDWLSRTVGTIASVSSVMWHIATTNYSRSTGERTFSRCRA
jgi:colanic acid/amylovoran biosynthesis glycosyltransferase